MITYMWPVTPFRASRTTCSAWSMACCVGQIVSSPCSPYQAARAGSATRTTTRGTLKRRWASWAMTRLVLSPRVAAMNTSACSIPASTRPSTSSAAPTVNRPPASSQLIDWSLSSRSCDSGSLSSTETSCPASNARLATADPTRPAPTIRMNMGGTLGPLRREMASHRDQYPRRRLVQAAPFTTRSRRRPAAAGVSAAATITSAKASTRTATPSWLDGIGSPNTIGPAAIVVRLAAALVSAIIGTASPSWRLRAEMSRPTSEATRMTSASGCTQDARRPGRPGASSAP